MYKANHINHNKAIVIVIVAIFLLTIFTMFVPNINSIKPVTNSNTILKNRDQPTNNLSKDVIVLISTSSSYYNDFKSLIEPYLKNFGIPYYTLDISNKQIHQNITNNSIILIGHREIDPNDIYLSPIEEQYITSAIFNGTGLINFDNNLSINGITPRYQFVQDIFNFSYNTNNIGNSITFKNIDGSMHYISEKHTHNEVITTENMILAGINSSLNNYSILAITENQPFIVVTDYGLGHAVQWSSYDWISHEIKGPLFGLDDIVWRSIVWASRKPFVMQGLPHFVTLRVDDDFGDLWWVYTSNEYGFKPWLGVFIDEYNNSETDELKLLVDDGIVTASIHAFSTSGFFYFDHSGSNWPDNVINNHFNEGTQWHIDNNISISKFVLGHYYEIGSNAFEGLSNWSVEFLGIPMEPGLSYGGSPWLNLAPYRIYENGSANNQDPFFYADFLEIPGHPEYDHQFFNCFTEIRDVTGYEWFPNNNVQQSIDRGTEWLTRALDSMALSTLFTHGYEIYPITPSNWDSIMEGITENIAPYNPIYVTLDYACQYVRAMYTSNITHVNYNPNQRLVTTKLEGYTDMSTKFYLFNETENQINHIMVDVPAFNNSTQIEYQLPGPLHHINITPNPATVIAGTNQQFTAIGYDLENNTIPNLIFNWSIVNGGGIIDNNTGLFTADITPGSYQNTVVATHGIIEGNATVEIIETTLDHFTFEPIRNPRYKDIPFQITIKACDDQENIVVGYNKTANLTDTTGSIQPNHTGKFTNGIWNDYITIFEINNSVNITIDDNGIKGTSNNFATINLPLCPHSIWNDTTTPDGNPNEYDGQPLEVGVKFQSDIDGYIIGLKFYKGNLNTGTHIGHLWTKNGTLLTEETFIDETTEGWQEVYLSNPVQITADTTYIASYHSPNGYIAQDYLYFTTNIDNLPLHALEDGFDGPNGVYIYGPSGSFPNSTYQASNYWVDVIFDTKPYTTYSIWNDTFIPSNTAVSDGRPIEVGVKFQSETNGSITGIRFYKGSANTGTHIGHLWANNGTLLAEETFTNETTEGWQEVTLYNPINITKNTTYVASYFSNSGYFAIDSGYFTTSYENPPLRALAHNEDGPNGVFRYDTSGFPNSGNGANYWVDIIFKPDKPLDNTPPTVTTISPENKSINVSITTNIVVTFNEDMDASTINNTTFQLINSSYYLIPSQISYNSLTKTATLDPLDFLSYSNTYNITIKGGVNGVTDSTGNPMQNNFNSSFTTTSLPLPPADEGPGGPILIISHVANPFSRYYAEILRTEGFNSFTVTDIRSINSSKLNKYDIIILGEIPLNNSQITLLSNWVNSGGNLIAMKPDTKLADLLGLTYESEVLSNGYLQINDSIKPGKGIVNETLQFHGNADLYNLNGSIPIAMLYTNSTNSSIYPAVTVNTVGSNGGEAAAFTYDLAKSIVYTRQGNPAWEGQDRDGNPPIRSNDLFYGDAAGDTQADWNNLDKIAIPQADEQQRLLANMIINFEMDNMPIPRFWYFPRGEKAIVILTGDDHGTANITGRLDRYKQLSPINGSVENWECVRSTSYLYTSSNLNDQQAAAYHNEGFEIGAHINTGCNDYTYDSLENTYTTQLNSFNSKFPSIPPQNTHRLHCVVWSDWDTQPKVELNHSIRFDTNYYYWPPSWVNDQPGFFTGSGMIMRFADINGTLIDVYQAATQMTDESGQSYPYTVNTLLDRAIGPQGYYGAFTANMHHDQGPTHSGAEAIIASAQTRDVPIVSAKQMMTWLDGRENSSIKSINWANNTLMFTITKDPKANGLQIMLPSYTNTAELINITHKGILVNYSYETIKGIEYAIINASNGIYNATYGTDTTPPTITNVKETITDSSASITWNTDEYADSRIDYGLSPTILDNNVTDSGFVKSHNLEMMSLNPITKYYYRISSTDDNNNNASWPILTDPPANFTTLQPQLIDTTVNDFKNGITDTCLYISETYDGELILAPTEGAEFNGTSLPIGWFGTPWGTGGYINVNNGILTLSYSYSGTNNLYDNTRSLEFYANFSDETTSQNQHIGFGTDLNDAPWAIFSTGFPGGTILKARTNNGVSSTDTDLGSYLGSYHLFRIEWTESKVEYYIDNTLVASHSISINDNMRPIASDGSDSSTLTIDWMRMSPYSENCSFKSRIFNATNIVRWDKINWTENTSTTSLINLSYRIGNTPAPNNNWTKYIQINKSEDSLTGNSQYLQYKVDLSTSNDMYTPSIYDVKINYSTGPDVRPPKIIEMIPESGSTNISIDTNVTIYFSEPMNISTINNETYKIKKIGETNFIHTNITTHETKSILKPNINLSKGTTYQIIVNSSISDISGNILGNDSIWTFTTISLNLIDTNVSDFSAGQINPCIHISEMNDGELMLSPTVGEEFFGTSLPENWTSTPWKTGGSSTVMNGTLIVDRARTGTNNTYSPGRILEFAATINAENYQHIGFVADFDFNNQWAMFSTHNTIDSLYARTKSDTGVTYDYLIPGSWLGSKHTYRIKWDPDKVDFYIDGSKVHSQSVVITSNMRPLISDINLDYPHIIVDWIRMTPFSSSCNFTSRVLGEANLSNWLELDWLGNQPSNTSIIFETRSGNTSNPDESWSEWSYINGKQIETSVGKYIQYKVNFTTSNISISPIIEKVIINYNKEPIDNNPPVISNIITNPDIQIKNGYVNISCIITDISTITNANVNITYPNNNFVNLTMNKAIQYYYNETYSIPGKYSYYIWTCDIYGNGNRSPSFTFNIIDLNNYKHISIENLWNLISLPFNQTIDKTDIFVSYNNHNYTWIDAVSEGIILNFVYGWDRINPGFVLSDVFEPGFGYWIWSYYSCEFLVDGNVSSDDYITILDDGWNIMGNPHDEYIWKNDLVINYNNTDYSWYEATTSNNEENTPLILDYIYEWNSASQSYTLSDLIYNSKGYWMYAYYNCTLKK